MAAKTKQYIIYSIEDDCFETAFLSSPEEAVGYLQEEYSLEDDEFGGYEVYEITSKPMKIKVTTKIEVK
jgi:hypothetical protein